MAAGSKSSKKTKLGDGDEAVKLDTKKKKKNLEPVEVVDQFDPDVLLDIKKDICVMCKGNHEVGLRLKEKIIVRGTEEEEPDEIKVVDPDSILDVNGVWASKYSIMRKSQRMFVHYYCAINSPQAIFSGKGWANLSKEVNRGRSLVCRYCGQNGATLGCFDSRCHVVMHVPCAVKLGFRRSGYKLSFLCEDHTKSYLDKELALDDKVRDDLSKGREPVPVTSVNRLDNALASDEVEYTKANLDSADVSMNASSVHEMDCCQCDGLCDDVAQCACLSLGRNYTFTGGLIPGAKKRVLECNLRCGCSIRRCTNRVVEKGPTYRLEVFRVPSGQASSKASSSGGSSSSSSTCGGGGGTGAKGSARYTWGVRTLDFIPENAFVCEVTGQYVLGRSESAIARSSNSSAAAAKAADEAHVPSVSDIIMADPASSQPQLLAYSTKVVPVRAWLEGERTNKGIFEPLAPALWAAEQESLSYARQKEEDWDHPQAASATSSASASATAAPSPSQPIHLEEGNGTRTAELLPISAGRKELSVPSALKILQSDREAVQRFLDGEICIDSRRFGNVGSFIRRRLHAQEAANRGGSSSSISSAGLSVPVAGSSSSSSSSGSNSGGGGGGDSGRMLHRRIVYTNKRYADRAPKLALFAARNIEPNTELLI